MEDEIKYTELYDLGAIFFTEKKIPGEFRGVLLLKHEFYVTYVNDGIVQETFWKERITK